MLDPLDIVNAPQTESLQAFSLYFQSSAASYEVARLDLLENGPSVESNWQGDASQAYAQKNQRLVSNGDIHVQQMQQAKALFEYTASQFQTGNGLQETAKWQLAMAHAAEMALNVPLATYWATLASKTQSGAVAIIQSARASFNQGFSALQAQIDGTPIEAPPASEPPVEPPPASEPPPAYSEQFQMGTPPPASQENPQVNAPNLPTPPLTPPLSPLNSEAPKSAALDKPQKGNASDLPTPPLTPPISPLNSEAPKSPLTQTPAAASQLKPVDLTGQLLGASMQLLGDQDHPSIRSLRDLSLTEPGQRALWVEKEYGGKLIITNGPTSSYESKTNTVTLGFGPQFRLNSLLAQEMLIHEQTHRYRAMAKLAADPLKYEQQDYVDRMLEEEAASIGNGAEHVMELRPNGPFTDAQWTYIKAFRDGQSSFLKAYGEEWSSFQEKNPEATERLLRAAGRKKGQAALVQAFKDKDIVPSMVPQPRTQDKNKLSGYEEYYADQWQRVRDGQQDAIVNSGPKAGSRTLRTPTSSQTSRIATAINDILAEAGGFDLVYALNNNEDVRDQIKDLLQTSTEREVADYLAGSGQTESSSILRHAIAEEDKDKLLDVLAQINIEKALQANTGADTGQFATFTDEDSQEEMESVSENEAEDDGEMEESSSSVQELTPRYDLRSRGKQRGWVEETNTTSSESSDDESILDAIEELILDSPEVENIADTQEMLLDPAEEAKNIKRNIGKIIGNKNIPVIFTPNSGYNDLKDRIMEELTSKKYTPEGKVEYLRLLNEDEQTFILKLGLGISQISGIRHLLSQKEIDAKEILKRFPRIKGSILADENKTALTSQKQSNKKKTRSTQQQKTNENKAELTLIQQANEIKDGIDSIIGKYSVKRAFAKENLEMKIKNFLKDKRFTLEGLAKYLDLLPEDELAYMLLLGFDKYLRGAVWKRLLPETQAAYRHIAGITDPGFQMPSYEDVEAPLSSDSELDDITPAASLSSVQQAKRIRTRIDTIAGIDTLSQVLSENVRKRAQIETILHEDEYVLEANVRFLKSLGEKEQGSVLRYAFDEGEVAYIWPYLSEGAKNRRGNSHVPLRVCSQRCSKSCK